MNIALIGMPASGKTYIGQRIAQAHGLAFIDPDKKIEREYQLPLQDVLEKLGEEAFLRKEVEVTKDMMTGKDGLLISTSGSVIYSPDLMAILSSSAKVIYLRSSLETITQRVQANPQRGIVGFGEKGLEQLYAERNALYEQWADATVNADQSPDSVVQEISSVIS